MSKRHDYPPGAPCWVDTFQPDPAAASRFYGGLLGWEFEEPPELPGGLESRYRVAHLRGSVVAGIGQAPTAMSRAVWSTYIRVDSVEDALTRGVDAGGRVLMGPLDTGADGRFAVLTDPSGVAVGLWQARARKGAQLVNEPGSWAMSALHTNSKDDAETFYGEVFGWQLEPMPVTPLSFWRLPGYVGDEPRQSMPRDAIAVLAPIEEASGVPPHWAVNFFVEDVDATSETALALGGTILVPPVDTPGFRSAVIADPQGGVIAISTPSNPPVCVFRRPAGAEVRGYCHAWPAHE